MPQNTSENLAFNRMARQRFRRAVLLTIERAGLSHAELAAALNTDYCMVQYICSHGVSPLSQYFLPVCHELGLDPLSFGFVGSFQARLEKNMKRGEARDRAAKRKRKTAKNAPGDS